MAEIESINRKQDFVLNELPEVVHFVGVARDGAREIRSWGGTSV